MDSDIGKHDRHRSIGQCGFRSLKQETNDNSQKQDQIDYRIEDKKRVAVVPGTAEGEKWSPTVRVGIVESGMCGHDEQSDRKCPPKVPGENVHTTRQSQRKHRNPHYGVRKATMVLDITGHAGDVEDDVDIRKIGCDYGGYSGPRHPLVNAGSRDRQTDKSVGGIEH